MTSKVLLTGATSFTGFWFAKALSESGFHVITPVQGNLNSYSTGVKSERVIQLKKYSEIIYNTSFGTNSFINIIKHNKFDFFCHHAAYTTDYKSENFNLNLAIKENTNNSMEVLALLKENNSTSIVLTGSIFEPNEGLGSAPLNAFSLYGLSKGITASIFQYQCSKIDLPFAKFIIPNPFGPYEEPRFCNYLIESWKENLIPKISTPFYIRDNIHIDLLSLAYVKFIKLLDKNKLFNSFHPSGYVESQGSFATRFKEEISKRLNIKPSLDLSPQTSFNEPMIRFNSTPAINFVDNWSESEAWDNLANYYNCKFDFK
jgi:UDP-glucose 4-epimerase